MSRTSSTVGNPLAAEPELEILEETAIATGDAPAPEAPAGQLHQLWLSVSSDPHAARFVYAPPPPIHTPSRSDAEEPAGAENLAAAIKAAIKAQNENPPGNLRLSSYMLRRLAATDRVATKNTTDKGRAKIEAIVTATIEHESRIQASKDLMATPAVEACLTRCCEAWLNETADDDDDDFQKAYTEFNKRTTDGQKRSTTWANNVPKFVPNSNDKTPGKSQVSYNPETRTANIRSNVDREDVGATLVSEVTDHANPPGSVQVVNITFKNAAPLTVLWSWIKPDPFNAKLISGAEREARSKGIQVNYKTGAGRAQYELTAATLAGVNGLKRHDKQRLLSEMQRATQKTLGEAGPPSQRALQETAFAIMTQPADEIFGYFKQPSEFLERVSGPSERAPLKNDEENKMMQTWHALTGVMKATSNPFFRLGVAAFDEKQGWGEDGVFRKRAEARIDAGRSEQLALFLQDKNPADTAAIMEHLQRNSKVEDDRHRLSKTKEHMKMPKAGKFYALKNSRIILRPSSVEIEHADTSMKARAERGLKGMATIIPSTVEHLGRQAVHVVTADERDSHIIAQKIRGEEALARLNGGTDDTDRPCTLQRLEEDLQAVNAATSPSSDWLSGRSRTTRLSGERAAERKQHRAEMEKLMYKALSSSVYAGLGITEEDIEGISRASSTSTESAAAMSDDEGEEKRFIQAVLDRMPGSSSQSDTTQTATSARFNSVADDLDGPFNSDADDLGPIANPLAASSDGLNADGSSSLSGSG